MIDWFDWSLVQSATSVVTAAATIVLAVLTWALVRATNAMARATAQPHVIASLESNLWSIRHLDLVVENAGNAPAYEVKVVFDPPIPKNQIREDLPMPFQNISLIRPSQILISSAADWATIKGLKFRVNVSWKRKPTDSKRESIEYDFDTMSLEGVGFLGRRSPEIQIAEEIKKIREDWHHIAGGSRRLQSDTYAQTDREREKTELDQFWRQQRSQEPQFKGGEDEPSDK
jgi:hypothetical protein